VSRRAAALLLCFAGCGTGTPVAEPARPVPLVVTRGTLEDRVTLTGEMEAASSENLVVPRTPAWILNIRWLVADGAVVAKGDRVAEFDSSAFAGSLEDKRLAVVRAASEVASEQAQSTATETDKAMEVERTRADLDKARVEASVPADLQPRRVHQEKQLALAQQTDALVKADAELATQRRASRLEHTVKTVALARAERELKEIEDRLDELTLRAPRAGLAQIAVNRRENRKFQLGDQAWAGMPVALLPDLSRMQVRARLPDVDDGAVRQGMRADCVLDAYPDRVFAGTVREVSPVARPEGRDSTRRFFDVVLALDKADPAVMRPGMSIRVEVVRRRAADALIVPRAALHTMAGKARVKQAGGHETTVEVQWCTPRACVVRGGVREGTALLAVAGPGEGAS
jgi:multidrug efflux pump subunit AcrA (membrane-fusion protein)